LEGLPILSALMPVVTGGEAMYDDLGHFGARPIKHLAPTRDRAVDLEVLDQRLQLALLVALDPERARNVALGDAGRRFEAVGRGSSSGRRDIAPPQLLRGAGRGIQTGAHGGAAKD